MTSLGPDPTPPSPFRHEGHSVRQPLSSMPSALDRIGANLASAPRVGNLLKQVTPSDFHDRAEALQTGPVKTALAVIAGEDVLTKSTGTVVKALTTALEFPYAAASLIGYVADKLASPATAVLVTDDRIRAHSTDALLIADAANCARLGILGHCPSWKRIQDPDGTESIERQLQRLEESIRTDQAAAAAPDPVEVAVSTFSQDEAPSTPEEGPAPEPPSEPEESVSSASDTGAAAEAPPVILSHTAAAAMSKLLASARWASRREYMVAGMLLEQLRQQLDTETE